MNKIVKVEYSDGSILELKDIKPLEILVDDSKATKKSKTIRYKNQFKDFEESILNSLEESNIEDYAEFKLFMVKDEDIPEQSMRNFADEDIMDECLDRESFGGTKSIVAADFLKRCIRIIDTLGPNELHKRLSKIEEKFNVI